MQTYFRVYWFGLSHWDISYSKTLAGWNKPPFLAFIANSDDTTLDVVTIVLQGFRHCSITQTFFDEVIQLIMLRFLTSDERRHINWTNLLLLGFSILYAESFTFALFGIITPNVPYTKIKVYIIPLKSNIACFNIASLLESFTVFKFREWWYCFINLLLPCVIKFYIISLESNIACFNIASLLESFIVLNCMSDGSASSIFRWTLPIPYMMMFPFCYYNTAIVLLYSNHAINQIVQNLLFPRIVLICTKIIVI